MIVETIFSTIDASGRANFAPMGIEWGSELFTVRPFRTTQTCQNLLANGHGVVNLSDDVLAYVRCALYDAVLPYFPAKIVPGIVFNNSCSWREVALVSEAGTAERAELCCRVVHTEFQKEFLGFRRAGNAVIEATILATRLALYDRRSIIERLNWLAEIVQKTGDNADKEAFRLVREYVRQKGDVND